MAAAIPRPGAGWQVRPGSGLAPIRHLGGGIGAVGVKELRGRMRGRRAFVILTIYLVLLGGFAWMVELIMERAYTSGFGNGAGQASASIGQGIFAALLMLETLQVVFLAPASTAGSISLEREKQTLELLVVTPISSLAIVIGKLFSALIYVWLLIAASIPLTAVVFVYGGVAPDDVLRGYIVLVVTALGFGAFGQLASSLVKRTQAAIAISVFAVLFASIGTLFLLVFWQSMGTSDEGRGVGPIRGQPPAVLAYLNPFSPRSTSCAGPNLVRRLVLARAQLLPDPNGVIFQPGNGIDQPVPCPRRSWTRGRDRLPNGVIDTTGLSPEDLKALQRSWPPPTAVGSSAAGSPGRPTSPRSAWPATRSGRRASPPGSSCRWSSCRWRSSSCRRPAGGACAAAGRSPRRSPDGHPIRHHASPPGPARGPTGGPAGSASRPAG